ncbi:MAG: SCP2 sterol-binding domain-containing protein [bacterium]|nr:SCP2 sterol-binding domain-containing protein [bacterium]
MAVSRDEIAKLFPAMVGRFDPAKAEGINATIQFDLSGENGGLWWLKIADGKAESGEGAAEGAKMTLKAAADDFVSMMSGSLNPMQAFMMGKIKVMGDTGLALKLMPLING